MLGYKQADVETLTTRINEFHDVNSGLADKAKKLDSNELKI
jgi:hypothetical protein